MFRRTNCKTKPKNRSTHKLKNVMMKIKKTKIVKNLQKYSEKTGGSNN